MNSKNNTVSAIAQPGNELLKVSQYAKPAFAKYGKIAHVVTAGTIRRGNDYRGRANYWKNPFSR